MLRRQSLVLVWGIRATIASVARLKHGRFPLRFLPLLWIIFFYSCNEETPLSKLERTIEEKITEAPGTYAVAFKDLGPENRTLLINEEESFHAASTMKTPVMIEVFKQATEGHFDLKDSIVIENEFKSIVDGSSYEMQVGEDSEEKLYARIGEKTSIYDLVYDMIIYSSNLATNILIQKVDAKVVTQTMRTLGAANIQVLRGVEDLKAYEKGMNNTTTAHDLMAIFEKIGSGLAVSEEASEEMVKILLDQKFNEGIPALLPKEVQVAHKTGWISTANHDSALVILPDGRKYVLVILTKNWESSEDASKLIAEISKIIYDYFISHST